MLEAFAKKNAAWAAEMQRAQSAALLTAVVDGEGSGVYLVAGGSDVDLVDADPAPGMMPRWVSPSKSNDMAKVVDRQLGEPQVNVPLGDAMVRTHGTFAGPSGKPFSLCHLSGNKFWLQGGEFQFEKLVGYDEEQQPIMALQTVTVESRSILAALDRTTLLGFACQYRKSSPTDWAIDFRFEQRAVLPAEIVTTGPVCGMQVSFMGADPVINVYTPIGSDFLPWIALHTQGRDAFWQQQVSLLPSSYISPSQGFIWWP